MFRSFDVELGGFFADFKVGKHSFDFDAFIVEVEFCVVYYIFRYSEHGSDCKSVRFARNADNEPVCRLQRCNVKFARSVFDVGRLKRIEFQFRIVGRAHYSCARRLHLLDYRNGKCRTLDGICSRAEFVHKHK